MILRLKLSRWKKPFLLLLILAIVIACLLYPMNGCRSTGELEDFRASRRIALDVNEPAPFAGMLIEFEEYYWFLKCENLAQQEGIMP